MSEDQVAPRLLPTHVVLERIAISRTQLYRLINAGQFPKPLPIGRHRVAFLESEISSWIGDKARLRDTGFGSQLRRERAIRAVGGGK